MHDERLHLFTNEVIDSLDPVLQRRGFWRHDRGLHVIEPDDVRDDILASWMRDPPNGRFPEGQPIVAGEGVSVWRALGRSAPGYVNVGLGSMHARFEWRKTGLDPDEFAYTIDAFIGRVDDFDPPRYIQERHSRR